MGISSALGSSALLPAGLGFRNAIINGDFRVAQRGASAAMNTGQFAYVSVDRWAGVHYLGGATMAQVSSTAPQGFQYSLKFGRNSGNTSTNVPSIGQTIESVNCYQFQGKQATLSFYAKAGANFSGSAMTVQCVTGTGTDEGINKAGGVTGNYTGTATPLNTTQAITTSWVRYSFLFPVSATATEMTVFFSYTPSGTAGADDNIYITGVQLEQNYQPTPFEQRPIGIELQLCQRYYEHNYGTGYAVGSAAAYPYNQPHTGINGYTVANQQKFLYSLYMVPKRRVPDITIYDTAGNNGKLTTLDAGGTGTTNVTVGISSTTDKMIGYAPSAGTYAGYVYFYVASAEL